MEGRGGIVILLVAILFIQLVSSISINLNSPIDNFNSTSSSVVFNENVLTNLTDTLINVSLVLNDVINETDSSGIEDVDYIFIKNLAD